jgi:hypothetical protein
MVSSFSGVILFFCHLDIRHNIRHRQATADRNIHTSPRYLRTRLQGEWSRVERFSIKPGEVGLTTLKEASDGIDQDTKGRLAQLATGLA